MSKPTIANMPPLSIQRHARPHKLDDDGHALDRFIERHLDPDDKYKHADVSRDVARTMLESIRASSDFVEDLPDEDQQIWRGRGHWRDVLLVVRDGVVRTVLPRGATRPASRRR